MQTVSIEFKSGDIIYDKLKYQLFPFYMSQDAEDVSEAPERYRLATKPEIAYWERNNDGDYSVASYNEEMRESLLAICEKYSGSYRDVGCESRNEMHLKMVDEILSVVKCK